MSEAVWIEQANPETGNNTYINPKFLESVNSGEAITEVNTAMAHIPTAEETAAVVALLLKDKAKQYLIDTDWYVSRKAEAGTEIPADILALRQQSRLDASS